ncbi:WecB/TagA/CpsF family glycosyltransferase [Cytobacillus sp. FSL R7-0696]|uniref:WecB/TagA/CpsF family glycosyltransferase n=1 Tax=Cytobacillus TaxID=2675230 RepID=UPI0030FBB3DB
MSHDYVNILGVPFINTSFTEMESILTNHIDKQEKTFVVTANPEIVMYAKEHKDYQEIIQSAHYVVPDGNGILLAANMLQKPIKERVTGFDLTMSLLEEGNKKGWHVYLLGGREQVNKRAAENIEKDYPGINLVGRHNGYFDWEDGQVAEEVAALAPDIVLVALGFPRQEEWITTNYHRFSKGLFIGVGGTIDIISGEMKRAPEFWQNLKLEWFYRLLKQPSRWRRVLVLPQFVKQVRQSRKRD